MISHKNLFGISKNRFFHEISFVNDITFRSIFHFLRSYCIKGFQNDIELEPLYHVQKGDNTANFFHDNSKPDKKEERRSK